MAQETKSKEDVNWEVDENNQEAKETKDNSDALQAVLDRMDALEAENKVLKQQVDTVRDGAEEGEDAIIERIHATEVTLATLDDAPIVDLRLEKETGTDGTGNYFVKGYTAVCKVAGKDKEIKTSYGDRNNPRDFINLPRKKFTLVDQDPGDLSGASRIERNTVVDNFGKTAEIIRGEGESRATGRMVSVVTRRDVRYYTIEFNGEKIELAEDKLYR